MFSRLFNSAKNWIYDHPVATGLIAVALVVVTGGAAAAAAGATVGFIAGMAVAATEVAVLPSVYHSVGEERLKAQAAKATNQDDTRRSRIDDLEAALAKKAGELSAANQAKTTADTTAESLRKQNTDLQDAVKTKQQTLELTVEAHAAPAPAPALQAAPQPSQARIEDARQKFALWRQQQQERQQAAESQDLRLRHPTQGY